jgi:predicted aspartyl protease
MGRNFLKITRINIKMLIVLFCCLLGPVQCLLADGPRPPEVSGVELDENGQVILKVTLSAGVSTVRERTLRFILDTGAAFCILDAAVPEAFFWEDPAKVNLLDATGAVVPLPVVLLKRMEVGGLAREAVPAVRTDLRGGMVGRFQDEPVDGLLGMSLLAATRFLLDVKGRQLQWWNRQLSGGVRLPLTYGSDHVPQLTLRAGGKETPCVVDTGMFGGLSLPWSMRPEGPKGPVPSYLLGLAGRTSNGKVVELPEVAVGGSAWRNVQVHFQEGQGSGMIGMDVWASAPVCFDFIGGHVTLAADLAGLPILRLPQQPLPIWWDRTGPAPRLTFHHVKPGSPMAASGFQAGDEVLQVGPLQGNALTRRAIAALVAAGPQRWLVRRNQRTEAILFPRSAGD